MLKTALSTGFSYLPSALTGRRSTLREGLIAPSPSSYGPLPPSPSYISNDPNGDYMSISRGGSPSGSRSHSRSNSFNHSGTLPPPPASPGFAASLDTMRRTSHRMSMTRSCTEPGLRFPTLNTLQNSSLNPNGGGGNGSPPGGGVAGSLGRPPLGRLEKRTSSLGLAPLDFAPSEGGGSAVEGQVDTPGSAAAPGMSKRRAHDT